MVADQEWLSATRATGLAAYAVTFVACAWRWAMCRKRGVSSQPFAGLMIVQFCLFLDMAFDLRWMLHAFEVHVALEMGVYDQRSMPQLLALALLPLVFVFVSTLIFRKFRHRTGAALALTGTLASVGLWCCEWVSYHSVDNFLYQLIGRVMVVSLIWIGIAVVTCFGVWLDGLSHSRSATWRTS